MAKILAIRPQESDESKIVGAWLEDWEQNSSHSIESLHSNHATRKAVEDVVQQALLTGDPIRIIAFYGHGTRCRLCVAGPAALNPGVWVDVDCEGCKLCDEYLVQFSLIDLENHKLFQEIIFYTVACHSYFELGKALIDCKVPGTAYFGYDEMVFLPVTDQIKAGLKEVVNHGLDLVHHAEAKCNGAPDFDSTQSAIKAGLLKLSTDTLRNAGNDPMLMMDGVFVTEWQNFFRAKWV